MPACKCHEAKAPLISDIPIQSNDRPRQWFVIRRNFSCSAFTGYRKQWSDYSDVYCRVCGRHWRTKSAVVRELEDCEFWPERNPPKVEEIPR